MNEPDRAELARLKEQQARLETGLKLLSLQLQSFEQRINEANPQEALSPGQPAPNPAKDETAPKPLPSIFPVAPPTAVPPLIQGPLTSRSTSVIAPQTQAEVSHLAGSALNAPPPTPVRPQQAGTASLLKLHSEPDRNQNAPFAELSAKLVPPPRPIEPAPNASSFEMRLGTFWLVRVGIVMVLTGLVFFGNLAYQNYISRLGPGGKVFLLYLASASLLAAGWWWQRNAVKDTLRNYAQVLFAGGLAALYFTTYAAHHLEPLQIIRSAQLDGLLLLACAGFMIWAAERKKSEVLALFAVGLAYYTSIITRVGYFTLWSNLVLSVTAVAFLVRNRWAKLSFGSLAATYAAYAFWRFFDGNSWHWASPDQGLWSGTCFLILYWLVFTSAVFLSRDQKFSGLNRASFLTFNNGAFFSLFLLTMVQVQHGGFWRFSLIYGAVLLGLSILARRLLPGEPLCSNAYLTLGLLLVTVGFISKFAGLQLALILATESVLLLIMGQQRRNLVLITAAYIVAALGVGWGMDGLKQFDTPGLWLGSGLGILMLANTFLTHRHLAAASPRTEDERGVTLRPQPSYFTVLALAIWIAATWDNTGHDIFPVVLAAEALVLSFSIYILGVREVSLLSQGLMMLAQGTWLVNFLEHSPALPWWNPAAMVAFSLVLSHWWPRQHLIRPKAQNALIWPAIYAVGLNLVLYLWLAPRENPPGWLFMSSLLAIGLTVYGVATRAWFVAACAQLFMAVSVAQFGLQLWQAVPPWRFPLAPIGALCLLSFGTVRWFQRRPGSGANLREPLLQVALIYRWIALVLSIAWICEYVHPRERIWLLALLGFSIFLWAGWRRNQEALLFGAVFTAVGLALFWLPLFAFPTVYLPNLLAIIALMGQRQIARKFPERYPLDTAIHNAVILIGGLSLWLFVSRWLQDMAGGFYLTASWSVLALGLFTAGLLLRERMYRWVGLGILACALGRVVVFDVWKLETVYRILSFMALGIVLLVLGFIYSKYQEKIKEWL